MKIVFRRDDRPQSGLGHVVRCKALADALAARGHEPLFARADEATQACDLIVVDSYDASPSDIRQWTQTAPVVVIDDLADRDLRDAAAIVNQNFGADSLTYQAGGAAMILGPSFAMLRPQFQDVRAAARRTFSASDNRVLITLGGGPVMSHLSDVLETLARIRRRLRISVLGMAAPPQFSSRHDVSFVPRSQDPATLMAAADVCVCAGGVSSLELACLGTPCVIVTLAPNQEPAARARLAADTAVIAGRVEHAMLRLHQDVERLLDDPARREALSRLSSALVDGGGAARVAQRLELLN